MTENQHMTQHIQEIAIFNFCLYDEMQLSQTMHFKPLEEKYGRIKLQ